MYVKILWNLEWLGKYKQMHFIWVSKFLAQKVLIEDTIFTSPTGDGNTILCGASEPPESLAVCTNGKGSSFISRYPEY